MKKMKLPILVTLFSLLTHSVFGEEILKSIPYFIKNNGQIFDQNNNLRKDIDYLFRAPGLNIMVGRGKIHYYFYDTKNELTTFQRTEMNLQNFELSGAIIAEGGNGYVEHYYQNGNSILNVPAAERICYKNIYKNIDWVLYINNGKLEYEFILHKGAKASDIKWNYKGAKNLNIDNSGAIVWSNSIGQITEQPPISFDHNGKNIISAYVQSKNTFAYDVQAKNKLTIDPTVEWASYLGGTGNTTRIYSGCADHNGYLYSCGISTDNANLASTGAFQTTLKGLNDGFISKFDTSGHQIWTTYYGGENGDLFSDIQFSSGNLYCTGWSLSKTGITTSGVQQEIFGGSGSSALTQDAILIKFDTNGMRVWGTYCGGVRNDVFNNLTIDEKGYIYAAGYSASKTNISTPGSFQDTVSQASISDTNVIDGIIVKYNSDGKRIWGTYVGGFSTDYTDGIIVKGSNLFVSGNTNSSTNIATSGSFQTVKSTGADAYIMNFDTAGNRLWGSYYGGTGTEQFTRVTCNSKGYVYISGTTNSITGIASSSAWQKTIGGKNDLYLAKFSPTGIREWGTYLGGSEDDYRTFAYIGGKIECDTIGDENTVYLYGETKSEGLATSDAYQKTLASMGKFDAFLAAFSGSGNLTHFTYYGGTENDYGMSTITDAKNFYLVGSSSSTSNIATKGAYKDTLKNAESGFIVKFKPGIVASLEEISSKESIVLNLFPNPASNQISVKSQLNNVNGIAIISILNLGGKVVQRSEAKIDNGMINHTFRLFQTLAPGVYNVQVNYGSWNQSATFMKE